MAGDDWFNSANEPSVPGGAPLRIKATFVPITTVAAPTAEKAPSPFHNSASIAGGFTTGHTDPNNTPGMLGKGHPGLDKVR